MRQSAHLLKRELMQDAMMMVFQQLDWSDATALFLLLSVRQLGQRIPPAQHIASLAPNGFYVNLRIVALRDEDVCRFDDVRVERTRKAALAGNDDEQNIFLRPDHQQRMRLPEIGRASCRERV